MGTRGKNTRRRGIAFGVTSSVSARAFLVGQMALMTAFGPVTLMCEGRDAAGLADAEGAAFREVRLPRRPSPVEDARALVTLVSFLRKDQPFATILGTPKMAVLGGMAAWLTGVPQRIYVMHGLRLEGAVGMRRVVLTCAEWVTCRLATEVIAVSNSLASAAVAERVVGPDKVRVLHFGSPNGVDTAHYRPPTVEERDQARTEFGCAAQTELVAFVGRITRDKGVAELADAWTHVTRQLPMARLAVAGALELTDDIRDKTQQMLDRDDVLMLGHIDPRQLFWAADLLVLPTHREGLGLVVLEAAACGLPAVTTDVTGARDSVVHGVTGYLVPAKDSIHLGRRLVDALGSNARGSLGMAARHRVIAQFDRQTVWRHWVDEMRRLGAPEAHASAPGDAPLS